MATGNIQPYLEAIQTAIYGRDVRGSIYEGVRVLNDIVSKTVLLGSDSPVGVIEPTYLDMIYIDIENSIIYKTVSGQNNAIIWENQGAFDGRGLSGGFVEVTPQGSGRERTYEIAFDKGTPETTQIHINDGKGITEITGPVSDGLDDVYTIHYNDGDDTTFIIHNAKSISEMTGPETEGLTDTYTIKFNDNTEKQLDINNGDGITEITGPETEGLEDTYTIHYKNAEDSSFIIRNGKDGSYWYRGTSIYGKDINPTVFENSGIPLAREDEFYLNPVEGAVYYCHQGGTPDVAAWVFDFVITGSGSTGIQLLSDLVDVNIDTDSLADGQVLTRVGNSWVNREAQKIEVLQSFNPNSKSALSGKAVAEALGIVYNDKQMRDTSIKRFEEVSGYNINEEAIYSSQVWTDGTNIYYSNEAAQYKLNGTTWEPMTWSGLTSFYGQYVWTDGNNIYYSYGSNQYKLNGTTWEPIVWSGFTNLNGRYVWTDGNDIYYSYGSNQYKLNAGTQTWVSMTWSGLTEFDGRYIWTDGTNIYYSIDTAQYKLNGTTWVSMTWTGLTNFDGSKIWTDGKGVYYTSASNQYKLNGTTWIPIKFDLSINGQYIWSNGFDIFYSNTDTNKTYRLYNVSVRCKG